MLLTSVGLAVDIVGAWVLAVGLFRGPQMVLIYAGGILIRGTGDVARDRSYGLVGGVLLTVGFLGQGLGALNVGPGSDRQMAVICGALALLVGWGCAAWLLEAVRSAFQRTGESDDEAAARLDREREAATADGQPG